MIHIVKGFSIVNEADVFLKFSCLFYDPTDTGNLTSGSSAAAAAAAAAAAKSLSHVRLCVTP